MQQKKRYSMSFEVESGKSSLYYRIKAGVLYICICSQKLSGQGDLALQLLQIRDAVQLWEETISLSILIPLRAGMTFEEGRYS